MIIGSKQSVEKLNVKKDKSVKNKNTDTEPKDKAIISDGTEEIKHEPVYIDIKTRGPAGRGWVSFGDPIKTRTYRVRGIERKDDETCVVKFLDHCEVDYNAEAMRNNTWLRTKSGRPLTGEGAARLMGIDLDNPQENSNPVQNKPVAAKKDDTEEKTTPVYLKMHARGSVYSPFGSMIPFSTRHYRVRNIEKKDDETFTVTIGKNTKVDYNHDAIKRDTWLETASGRPLTGEGAARLMGIDLNFKPDNKVQ